MSLRIPTGTPEGESLSVVDSFGASTNAPGPVTAAPVSRRSLRATTKPPLVIACWGHQGSGKSTIALNLVAQLASNANVLLIDADTHAPSQAESLAITEHPAGLAPMLRFARQGRLTAEHFDKQSMRLKSSTTFTLIPGINPIRWPEVTPQAFALLLEHVRAEFEFVVIDLASPIEAGLYQTESPLERNAFTRWVISTADQLISSFNADPVSFNRHLALEAELQELRKNLPTTVVANRMRRSALGATAKRDLERTIRALTGRKISAFLPEDSKAVDSSLRQGVPLNGARAGSPLRKAINQLAQSKNLAG